ncbi:MAG: DUF560 domain-containing protein [Rhodobacteraceae bacterium]|nr:DUF560 domain-containing protein [Paracoccaceae bacterium]
MRQWGPVIAIACCCSAGAHAADDPYGRALGRMLANPADPNVIFSYGSAAAEARDAAGVTASLERLLVFDPRLSNLRLELGLLHLRLGSAKLAEYYLRDALADPAMPAPLRARTEDLLADATLANRRWQLQGRIAAGLRYNTNANSGPNGTVQFVTDIGEVEGRLRREDTEQADYSATFTLSGAARYDLGTQAGHALVFPGLIYVERYRDQTQLDLGYANIAPGIEFRLDRWAERPAKLTVSTFLARLMRDGETYLDEVGLSAEAAVQARPGLIWRAGLSAKDQQFFATDDAPRNDDRDGGLYTLFGGALLDTGPRTAVSAEVFGRRKTAREDYEAYREWGGRAQILHRVPAPGAGRHGPWELSLLGSYSTVDYDDLDLSIDLDTAQTDHRYRIEGALGVPVTDRALLSARLGYYRNQSNFAIRDYDDTYVTVELSSTF